MNNTVNELFERKSVRVFEKQDIPQEMKEIILESALQAPTAGNQIMYTILDIQDVQLKEKLAESCDGQSFIATAPLVLVFLADCRRWPDAYDAVGEKNRKPGTGDMLLAVQDAVIAAQNTVVCAHSFGLGSCYIGDIVENAERVRQLLNLDEYTIPITMLVYGWPTKQQQQRQKPVRFDKKYIVQTNQYHRLSPAQQQKMFCLAHKNEPNFDFARFVSAFCRRKYMSDFCAEMSRSCNIYIKPFMPQGE